jgi:hypothetical protein
MSNLTPAEIKEIASEAADEAVRKLLLTLGVATGDEKAMLAMQADFRHLRTWRESVETVKRRGLIAAVSFLVPAGLTALYIGFFKGH